MDTIKDKKSGGVLFTSTEKLQDYKKQKQFISDIVNRLNTLELKVKEQEHELSLLKKVNNNG